MTLRGAAAAGPVAVCRACQTAAHAAKTALSLTRLVLGHIAIFGVAHQADEGTAAHLWQLLMAGQIPVIAFFAVIWLPRNPKHALLVLLLQAIAGLAAACAVNPVRQLKSASSGCCQSRIAQT